MILQAGAGIIVNGLVPFSQMFQDAFGLEGVIAEDNAIAAAVRRYRSQNSSVSGQAQGPRAPIGMVTTPSGRVRPYPFAVMTPRTAGEPILSVSTLSANLRSWAAA